MKKDKLERDYVQVDVAKEAECERQEKERERRVVS